MGLHTCVLHGLQLFPFGEATTLIGEAAVGAELSIRKEAASWTGCRYSVDSDLFSFNLDARTTLPGPLYTIRGREWGFDWSVPNSPLAISSCPAGDKVKAWGIVDNLPQVCLIETKSLPLMLVMDSQCTELEIITHEHWRFRFADEGARVMMVPLLEIGDAPDTQEKSKAWLELLENPPLHAAQSYLCKDGEVVIETAFTDADGVPSLVAPLPPPWVLADGSGIVELPEYRTLCSTMTGPYGFSSGSVSRCTIAADWMMAKAVPQHFPVDENFDLPFELAYAGDASWDESTPMDQLLSWRLWARFARVIPGNMWSALRKRISLPTAEAFKKSLAEYTEPVTGRTWLKEAKLFEQCGDVSYDTDWYTGLTLSGLRNATECADGEIADTAAALAREVKQERQRMMAYYEIFCDWGLGASWTDCRGDGFNFDCAHNGLEGIVAEIALCEAEGDKAGADHARYLAALSAPIYIANGERAKLNNPGDEGEYFGYNAWREWRETPPITSASRAPYNLAGDFPAFSALLKKYGDVKLLKRQADAMEAESPERYSDWLAFYVGRECAASIRKGVNEMGYVQEAREQAPVFYHVAPDTCLRLWTLDQDPEKVIALYGEKMPIVYYICCKAAFRLDM